MPCQILLDGSVAALCSKAATFQSRGGCALVVGEVGQVYLEFVRGLEAFGMNINTQY